MSIILTRLATPSRTSLYPSSKATFWVGDYVRPLYAYCSNVGAFGPGLLTGHVDRVRNRPAPEGNEGRQLVRSETSQLRPSGPRIP